jgi:hypothetical protein
MLPHHHHHHQVDGGTSFCPLRGVGTYCSVSATNICEKFKKKLKNAVNGYLQKLLLWNVLQRVGTSCLNTILAFSLRLRYFRFLHSFLFIFVVSPA